MLAKTWKPAALQLPCFGQPKLNGVRSLYQTQTFLSRDEKLWRADFVQHIQAELDQLDLDHTILDGEFYVHGWRLQRINQAMSINAKVRGPNDDTRHVQYHIFDVVDPNQGFASRFLDISDRIEQLGLPHVKAVPTHFLCVDAEFDYWFHHYTALGFEGVMYRADAPYEFGESLTTPGAERRSANLWKRKQWQDAEFRVVRSTPGRGKASIGIGALVCDCTDFILDGERIHLPVYTEFEVGSGFSDEERVRFAQELPSLVRVRFLELTADGRPFNPSFIADLS